MLGGPLLPCSTCGAWAGEGALCAGCGAARAGQELVRLDQSHGDDRWVLRRRGTPESLAASLEAAVNNAPDPEEAGRRAGIARGVLRGLAPDRDVSLWLDLRAPEAGHLAKSKRRGSNEEFYWLLPWLALRWSEAGAPVRAWVIRVTHVRRRRSFGSAGVEDQATRFSLDELRVEQEGRGRLRRPLRSPASPTSLATSQLDPQVPAWEPLPLTAPRSAHAVGAPLLAGGLVSALVLILIPLLLSLTPAAPRAEPPGDWRALQAALTSGTPTAAVVRLGLVDESGDRRREALVAAHVLPAQERRRALRAAVHDRDPRVQEVALELAARDGERGGGLLAAVVSGERGSARDTERRLQALRLLVGRKDVRVAPLAVHGLRDGGAPRALRRGWVQALSEAQVRSEAVVRALMTALRDSDPVLKAQAGWALVRLAPEHIDAVARAWAQMIDALAGEPATPESERAIVTMARAMAEAAPGRARVALRRILAADSAALPRRLRRRLERLLQGLSPNGR